MRSAFNTILVTLLSLSAYAIHSPLAQARPGAPQALEAAERGGDLETPDLTGNGFGELTGNGFGELARSGESTEEVLQARGSGALRGGDSETQFTGGSLSGYTLSPDGRVCLAAQYGFSYVNIYGTAQDKKTGKGAGRFTLNTSPDNYNYSEFIRTNDGTAAFGTQVPAYAYPTYFPGWFKWCVRNTSSNPATVSLSISGN